MDGDRLRVAAGQRLASALGGGLAGRSPADGQINFPCTRLHGKRTKMKRTWGTYREAWRGGRGTGGVDLGGGTPVGGDAPVFKLLRRCATEREREEVWG
jgi:hypothetical protein